MKLKTKMTAIALSAAFTFSCVAMTACKNDTGHGMDPRILDVYTAYTENGGTLTYEEWYAQLLESAKGLKGDQGEKGEKGEKGDQGDQGSQGPAGNDGSSFLHGKGVPNENTPGKAGDLYLDTETWNVYERTENGWDIQPIGNLNGEVTNETYGSFWLRCHDYKTMPVGAFNAITYDLRENPTIYAAYKEAGVNMMIGGWEDVSLKALDLAAENGLGYLLSPSTTFANIIDFDDPRCEGNRERIIGAIEEAKYHKAFCGFNVMDEPGKIYFEAIAHTQDFLDAQMPSSVKGALWWTNLFPNYANSQQLYGSEDLPPELNGSYSYEQYIEDYMKICKPKVLSFDNYAPNVGTKNRGRIRGDYFDNLSICRRTALKANIPFWHFVQDCQFNTNSFAPNLAELLWSVNTGLSYGAKGIEYFTGVKAFPGQDPVWEGAMFDFDGSRTPIYELVKTANAQIGAVDEVLMCSKNAGIIVIGTTPEAQKGGNVKIPEADIIQTYGELSSVTAAHALIGCFDYNGKTAFYITNNSISESDTVKLNLNSFKGGYVVQKAAKTYFANSSLEFTLDAGEGVLVVIE